MKSLEEHIPAEYHINCVEDRKKTSQPEMDQSYLEIHSKKAESVAMISASQPTSAKFLKEIIGSESLNRLKSPLRPPL